MNRIIIDLNEKGDKRVYYETEFGGKEYYPFFDIKIKNKKRIVKEKRWLSKKEMDLHLTKPRILAGKTMIYKNF